MALFPMATGGGTKETIFITTVSDGGWDIRDAELTRYNSVYTTDDSFPIATINRSNATTLKITPHQNVTIAYALNKSTSQTVTYTEETVTAETTKTYTIASRSFFKIYK